ncbi:hypothetical protein [Conservatibacter flavescens]|uniref:Phospholipase n=1 Tax=Conservatibacter flavescens TaxID=28161 RepID=A0A2M8S3D9_9PAST|nr:hypothetical protein [Conservatibacter flavescens]PJG85636.1 hypothetical protein CVP05_05605 [Conservatibacter flavescens]
MPASPLIYVSKNVGKAIVAQQWFLPRKDQDGKPLSADQNTYVPSTIRPLINGEAAFTTLYDYIKHANRSIDIAIWGFQPSMFFKRTGDAQCIGDLLIEKALNNVQVKILVWSMWFNVQTFQEANLGNMPELVPWLGMKQAEDGVTEEQQDYDYWWYYALKGEIYENSSPHFYPALHPFEPLSIGHEAYARLMEFVRSDKRANLQFKKRSVAFGPRFDKPSSPLRNAVQFFSRLITKRPF